MSTTLPMFPLGSTLVPGMVLPLHVFEPRYRALVRDVLDGPGRFGVVLITHGFEVGGGERRTMVGTTAEVLDAQEYDDGRWGIISLGRDRFRVLEWLPDDPYPRARVEDWPDEDDDPADDTTDDPAGDADRGDAVDGVAQRLLTIVDLAARLGIEVDYPELSDDPATMAWQAALTASLGPQDIHELLTCAGPTARLQQLAEVMDSRIDVLRFRLANAG